MQVRLDMAGSVAVDETFGEGVVMSATPTDGWLTITALAEIRGVSKAAISKRVIRFERDNLVATRMVGKQKFVHAEMFDRACHLHTDGVRELNGTTRKRAKAMAAVDADQAVDAPDLATLAALAAIDACQAEVRLLEHKGPMVSVDEIEDAIARAEKNLAAGVKIYRGQLEEFLKGGEQQ
jgi:hypothetical protein